MSRYNAYVASRVNETKDIEYRIVIEVEDPTDEGMAVYGRLQTVWWPSVSEAADSVREAMWLPVGMVNAVEVATARWDIVVAKALGES